MKVLVSGGTGFVGRAVVRQLHAAEHEICLVVRDPLSPHARRLVKDYGVRSLQGNLHQPGSLRSACEGQEAIIHLAGIISEIRANTFESVHVQGTRHLVESARDAKIKKWVHMSALGARPNARSRYHQTKWAGEELVRAAGLDYTVFRPSIIYGSGDAFVNLFASLARFSPFIPLIGGGHCKLQPIAVDLAAHCFVRALEETKAIGKYFDLCGPEPLSLRELVDSILEVTRSKRIRLTIPMKLARVQACICELVFPAIFNRAAPLNRDQLLMLQEDNVGDPDPAKLLFQLDQRPFREGIKAQLKCR